MKIKVMKRENDIIIEYAREKKTHDLRYKALEFLVKTVEGSTLLYIDTNSKTKVIPISDIENVLKSEGISYECEAIESSRRGILGFSQMVRPYKKDKKLTEHIILAEIPHGAEVSEIYNGFLGNYDYALGMGSDRSLGELVLRLKAHAEDVLFNKKIFSNTLYDSIVIKRMRMDSPYESFAVFADALLDV